MLKTVTDAYPNNIVLDILQKRKSAIKNNKNMSLIKCRRNHRGVKVKFQGNHKK